ncbi:PREDICTED: peroxisomal carnitine O-octanoyltransferase-like [Priapulus caudatus]|uniref:Peroxisomal carnitine O-octanoyltransferase-like n=1 Tax=Priapulus caudatus TaxID=37621 RepID=A0ABM1E2L4_PRICU|nr:PREDICTED: peroxisomal carnitine O-octanoyltransferase-like [Priapulus caudatus]
MKKTLQNLFRNFYPRRGRPDGKEFLRQKLESLYLEPGQNTRTSAMSSLAGPDGGTGEATFQFQDGLRSLPVPSLDQTLAKYLDSVRPHVTEAELQATEAIAERFRTGIGQQLQEKLLEIGRRQRNWVERFWEPYAYLDLRVPILPFVNFGGPGPLVNSVWPAEGGTQLERAALFVWMRTRHWLRMRRQEVKAQTQCRHGFSASLEARPADSCVTSRDPPGRLDHSPPSETTRDIMGSRPAATYETATTRKFYHGRTETVRSCTVEGIEWCRSMLDGATTPFETKLSLLRRAREKQAKLMREAMNGEGCDRHLFGLYCLAMEEGLPIPQLYTDPSWSKSGGGGNFTLSTSWVGYTTVSGGVGPMCSNGYGCFYRTNDEKFVFYISRFTADADTSCSQFYDSLKRALRDQLDLWQAASAEGVTAKL